MREGVLQPVRQLEGVHVAQPVLPLMGVVFDERKGVVSLTIVYKSVRVVVCPLCPAGTLRRGIRGLVRGDKGKGACDSVYILHVSFSAGCRCIDRYRSTTGQETANPVPLHL